jgi:hypothetical protein
MGDFDALGKAKELAELVRQCNNEALHQKAIDLRDAVFNLSEENLQLGRRVRELEERQLGDAELFREGNAYYRGGPEGQKLGPFCLPCWDVDRRLINVDQYGVYDNPTIECGRCKRTVVLN